MPYFPGFPKKEGTGNRFFEASMLALLKPWSLLKDLKEEGESFQDTFDLFTSTASDEVLCTIKNIQFYLECCESMHSMLAETRGSSDAMRMNDADEEDFGMLVEDAMDDSGH
jgi:hypothetical protein